LARNLCWNAEMSVISASDLDTRDDVAVGGGIEGSIVRWRRSHEDVADE
jgi:hypothetical protein